MVSVIVNLDTVVQDYFNDSTTRAAHEIIVKQRRASVPHYKYIITQFVNGVLNLDAWRNELKTLHQDKFWGGHTAGFIMELNKLVSNHIASNPELETHVRIILTGLSKENMGQRIEQFYTLLIQEKERLQQRRMTPGQIVSPGNSAFVISLLASWNDSVNAPYIYYPSVRLGLAALINAKLIPPPSEIQIDKNGVHIISEADHLAASHTLDNLATAVPQLSEEAFWAENFLDWLHKQIKKKPDYLKIPIYFSEAESVAEEEEISAREEEDEAASVLIDDQPLMPTPEPLLTRLIAELRQHILIEESVVRRIYQNLLNGHVILTGPPGTGKTELARLLPEILWQSEVPTGDGAHTELLSQSAYTATLVTATNEWSTRTLISSIAPLVNADKVAYRTQRGHLTTAILRNWAYTIHAPAQWEFHGRKRIQAQSYVVRGVEREYQGHWLIIDEFNRAPIDAALGEALTALSDGEALLVPIDGTYVNVPLPKDFRIIGTLNSFDRNYLNSISEALKRRFAFIEILPPSRAMRKAEQDIVRYKALRKTAYLSTSISVDHDPVAWRPHDIFVARSRLLGNPFEKLFYHVLWPLFEIMRIYRQLGTAQAIRLVSQVITTGLLQNYTKEEEWLEALDMALCDTIADQLQVLLPDELEVLSWVLKYDVATFSEKYTNFLAGLVGKQRRQSAHLEALGALVGEDGQPLLSDAEIEQLLEDEGLQIAPEVLAEAFHLEDVPYRLPHFSRRLRILKAERGL